MFSQTIPFSEMVTALAEQGNPLLSLDEVRERLSTTEPLEEVTVPSDAGVHFTVPPGWADVPSDDSPTGVIMHLPSGEQIHLSKKAVLESGAQPGAPRGFQQKLPAAILQDTLNWWFGDGSEGKEYKTLLLGQPPAAEGEPATEGNRLALALCRGTIMPFSNLRLLEIALERIRHLYGEDTPVYGDYKLHHDLELTTLRLIIPADSRVIEGTRQPDDRWSIGLDIRNSLVGLKPPDVCAYAFRWWCTNGSTDTMTSSGQFSRKGSHELSDVWTWAADAVDNALAGAEGMFEGIQALTGVTVNGDVTVVLRDLFAQYQVPVRERNRIISAMADIGGDITMYDLHAAITQAANLPGMTPRAVSQLLGLGGHVAHAATARCLECRRLLPDGYTVPGNHEGHAHAAIEAAPAS